MPGPYCLDCNYTLQGLTKGTCPECGRPFDLDDPKTYRSFRRQWVDRFYNVTGNNSSTADRLLGHLPYGRRQEILKTLGKTKQANLINLYFFAWLFGMLGLMCVGYWLYQNPANRSFLLYAFIPVIALSNVAIGAINKMRTRAFGRELLRMNIRPASCPKCGYNLAGIDAPECPKCQNPFAPPPPPPDDNSPV